jgi:hypothetical protein
MKFFLVLLLLCGITYGGYIYYRQSTHSAPITSSLMESSNKLIISQSGDKLSNLASVLGASISNTYENGKDLLSNATDGASEPIINELVSKTTETLKDLPRKEAEKIKYEFCKGVINEYENK